jgi:hypothetical protein
MKIPAKYRKALYGATTAALVVMVALGVITPSEVSQSVNQAVRIVSMLATVLALFNVNPE